MLEYLRKNTKLIVWFIVISFGIWGAGSIIFSGLSEGTATAGKAYGKKISNTEFNRHLKMVQIFGGKEVEGMSSEKLEEKVWQQIALAMKARNEGIKATDEEVRVEIIKNLGGGQTYDEELYQRWVQNVFREGPRAFEEKVRDLIAIRKLLDTLPADTVISDEDLKKKYLSVHPDTKPEEYEKVKAGYRLAMTELAKIEQRETFIKQVVEEAQIRNFLAEERKAKDEKVLETQVPGSPLPIRTPVPSENKK